MLKSVQKTKLAMAVTAVLAGAGIATDVSAVNLASADRLGDAGIFQFYTVNNTWQTFFRIVNTSQQTVLVKVRFREAENSREVLDFGIFLSPNDMYNFWTDPNVDGQGTPGIFTDDISCTVPGVDTSEESFISSPIPQNPQRKYATFKTRAFTGTYADGGDASIDRTKLGHVEFIGVASWDSSSTVETYARHGGSQNCEALAQIFAPGARPDSSFDAIWEESHGVGNWLAANAYLFRGVSGFGTGYDPVMLANFRARHRTILRQMLSDPNLPDMDSANPHSHLFWEDRAELVESDWSGASPSVATNPPGIGGEPPNVAGAVRSRSGPYDPSIQVGCGVGNPCYIEPVTGGVDAVSALIMRDSVINEWANRSTPGFPVSAVNTEWVLTFPTKHYYVDMFPDLDRGDTFYPTLGTSVANTATNLGNTFLTSKPGDSTNIAYPPFTNNFLGKSCEPMYLDIFGREEEWAQWTSPEPDPRKQLCTETNIVAFGSNAEGQTLLPEAGNTLEKLKTVVVPNASLPGNSNNPKREGWAQMWFTGQKANPPFVVGPYTGLVSECRETGSNGNICDRSHTYYGLPVVGFSLTNLVGQNVQQNLSTAHDHKYTRDIESIDASYRLTAAKTPGTVGTVVSDVAGINCGSDCSEVYLDGTAVKLTATATNPNFYFDSWSITGSCGQASNCGTDTGVCTLTVTAACTAEAVFLPIIQ